MTGCRARLRARTELLRLRVFRQPVSTDFGISCVTLFRYHLGKVKAPLTGESCIESLEHGKVLATDL